LVKAKVIQVRSCHCEHWQAKAGVLPMWLQQQPWYYMGVRHWQAPTTKCNVHVQLTTNLVVQLSPPATSPSLWRLSANHHYPTPWQLRDAHTIQRHHCLQHHLTEPAEAMFACINIFVSLLVCNYLFLMYLFKLDWHCCRLVGQYVLVCISL
jgi:hypothetical protein